MTSKMVSAAFLALTLSIKSCPDDKETVSRLRQRIVKLIQLWRCETLAVIKHNKTTYLYFFICCSASFALLRVSFTSDSAGLVGEGAKVFFPCTESPCYVYVPAGATQKIKKQSVVSVVC